MVLALAGDSTITSVLSAIGSSSLHVQYNLTYEEPEHCSILFFISKDNRTECKCPKSNLLFSKISSIFIGSHDKYPKICCSSSLSGMEVCSFFISSLCSLDIPEYSS